MEQWEKLLDMMKRQKDSAPDPAKAKLLVEKMHPRHITLSTQCGFTALTIEEVLEL